MRTFIRHLLLGPAPIPVPVSPPMSEHPAKAAFETRIRELEEVVAGLRAEIGEARLALEATNQRQNIALSLYEHRVDQIYRRVIEEFGHGGAEGRIVTMSEDEADKKLLALLSAGLETPVDLENLKLRDMVSQTISPGTIKGGLTLYGFRLNRSIARERGNVIHVSPSPGEVAIFGPYRKLAPGSYRATMSYELDGSEPASRHAGGLTLDIFSLATDAVLAKTHEEFGEAKAAAGPVHEISASFGWGAQEASGLIEIRLFQRSTAAVRVSAVSLERQEV